MKLLAEIKAILVLLAVNDQIPSDMNELDEHVFDPIIDKLNDKITKLSKIEALNQFLSDYPSEMSYEDILEFIANDMADEHEIEIWEKFADTEPTKLVEYIENSYESILNTYLSVLS
jgi:hypothetical protein